MGSGLEGSEGVRDSFEMAARALGGDHVPLATEDGRELAPRRLDTRHRPSDVVVVPEPFARPRVMPQPVRGHHDKHAALGGLTAKDGEHLEVARLEE